MSEKHTKTPWEYRPTFVETATQKTVLCVYGPRNSAPRYCTKIIFAKEEPTKEDEANAKFILNAVNSHDQLVEAVRLALKGSVCDESSCPPEKCKIEPCPFDVYREALKAAGEEV